MSFLQSPESSPAGRGGGAEPDHCAEGGNAAGSPACGLSLEKTTLQFSWEARKTALRAYFCVLCHISEIELFEAKNRYTRISEFSSLP